MANKTELDWNNAEWEGAAVQTDSVPLIDKGTGKPIVMRVFDFDLPPLAEEDFPTKEQLIDFHKTKITALLWRDELVRVYDFKLVFSKDKQHFKIFTACQAKTGSNILERPEQIKHL